MDCFPCQNRLITRTEGYLHYLTLETSPVEIAVVSMREMNTQKQIITKVREMHGLAFSARNEGF